MPQEETDWSDIVHASRKSILGSFAVSRKNSSASKLKAVHKKNAKIASKWHNPLWVDTASEDAGGQTVKVITSWTHVEWLPTGVRCLTNRSAQRLLHIDLWIKLPKYGVA